MGVRLKVILFAIFSMFIMGTTPCKDEILSYNFEKMEREITNRYEFLENGIKVKYYSGQNIKYEYDRLLKVLEGQDDTDIKREENNLKLKDKDSEISIVLWNEVNEVNVEISYINKNIEKSSNNLKEEIVEMFEINANDIMCFSFVKYKVLEYEKEFVNKLIEDNLNTNTIKALDINNGNVITSKLKDNQKVNLGFMKYDTGEHLYIGTPVIFVTY